VIVNRLAASVSECGVDEPVGEVKGEERARKEHSRQFVDGRRVFDRAWCVDRRDDRHQLE